MSGDNHSHDDVKKHIPRYLQVGAALFVLTIVTVGVGLMHIPSIVVAVAVGMLIATVKGGLVASVYMHLIGEKKIIYYTLIITMVCFLIAIVVPAMTNSDSVGTKVAPYVKVNSAHAHAGHGEEAGEGHGDHAADEKAAFGTTTTDPEVGHDAAEEPAGEAPAESH